MYEDEYEQSKDVFFEIKLTKIAYVFIIAQRNTWLHETNDYVV